MLQQLCCTQHVVMFMFIVRFYACYDIYFNLMLMYYLLNIFVGHLSYLNTRVKLISLVDIIYAASPSSCKLT